MHTIFIFGTLGTALASTLLLGPQWGAALGLLVYIAGSNVLLTREMNKLKAQLHKSFNDLPDLVNELVRQQLLELEQASTSTPAPEPPAAHGSEDKNDPLSELEQRLSALDGKFDTLVDLLTARETAVSSAHESGNKIPPPPEQRPSALDGEFDTFVDLLTARDLRTTHEPPATSAHESRNKITPPPEQHSSALDGEFDTFVDLLTARDLLTTHETPATSAHESGDKNPLPEFEQRLSALDSKFDAFVAQLIARQTPASQQLPGQPAGDSSIPPLATETSGRNVKKVRKQDAPKKAGAPFPPGVPQETEIIKALQTAALSQKEPFSGNTAELVAMRELLEKMAFVLAQQSKNPSNGKVTPLATPEAGQNGITLAPGSTMDQLRAALDKLALELRSEPNRPSF